MPDIDNHLHLFYAAKLAKEAPDSARANSPFSSIISTDDESDNDSVISSSEMYSSDDDNEDQLVNDFMNANRLDKSKATPEEIYIERDLSSDVLYRQPATEDNDDELDQLAATVLSRKKYAALRLSEKDRERLHRAYKKALEDLTEYREELAKVKPSSPIYLNKKELLNIRAKAAELTFKEALLSYSEGNEATAKKSIDEYQTSTASAIKTLNNLDSLEKVAPVTSQGKFANLNFHHNQISINAHEAAYELLLKPKVAASDFNKCMKETVKCFEEGKSLIRRTVSTQAAKNIAQHGAIVTNDAKKSAKEQTSTMQKFYKAVSSFATGIEKLGKRISEGFLGFFASSRQKALTRSAAEFNSDISRLKR